MERNEGFVSRGTTNEKAAGRQASMKAAAMKDQGVPPWRRSFGAEGPELDVAAKTGAVAPKVCPYLARARPAARGPGADLHPTVPDRDSSLLTGPHGPRVASVVPVGREDGSHDTG